MRIEDIATVQRRGIVEDLPFAQYRATPGLNPSSIVKRRKSAFACKWAYENPSGDTDAMLFGRFCHSLLFEFDKVEDYWVIHDGDRRGNAWKKALAEAEETGKEIIKRSGEYGADKAIAIVENALTYPLVREAVAECVREVSVFSEEFDMQVKGRLDAVDTKNARIVDAKFTNDIDPTAFGRNAAGFSYPLKLACYHKWFQRETGKEIKEVWMITVQTKDEPDVTVVPVPNLYLEDGMNQATYLMQKIAEDLRLGQWHGVDNGAGKCAFDYPDWGMSPEGVE